jgi:hypothetical protein
VFWVVARVIYKQKKLKLIENFFSVVENDTAKETVVDQVSIAEQISCREEDSRQKAIVFRCRQSIKHYY